MLSSINSNSQTQPKKTYAQTTNTIQKKTYPKKDQCIIINPIENIPLHEYILALGSVIDPNKIQFASRISNNRICVYLQSKNDVTTLLNQHKTIKVRGLDVTIRNFITPSHRMIVWIFPTVPNEIIIDELKKLQVIPLSELFYFSVGIHDKKYAHIKSFNRYMFIHENHPNLPELITINYENETYRMYISLDDTRCNLCQKFGHQAKECRTVPQTSQNQDPNTEANKSNAPNEKKQTTEDTHTECTINTTEQVTQIPTQDTLRNENIQDSQIIDKISQDITRHTITAEVHPIPKSPKQIPEFSESNQSLDINIKKRVLSNSSAQESETETKKHRRPKNQTTEIIVSNEEEISEITNKHTPTPSTQTSTTGKKRLINSKSKRSLPEMIDSIRTPMSLEPDKYPLNFEQLKNFIIDTYNNISIDNSLKKYNIASDHLIEFLNTIYYLLQDPIARRSLTKLIKKVKINALATANSDSDIPSDTSDDQNK